MDSKFTRRPATAVTRASVSFPSDVYADLERLAMVKKVSLAWVVREAAERYVAEQSNLIKRSDEVQSA
jgi:hypothetical protein